METEIAALEESGQDPEKLKRLKLEFEQLTRRMRRLPYIDPMDVRYNRFELVPKPVTQAVMFCLMDVSGSMTEHMKDLAKRFFMLLYLFLARRYQHVDIVFIRHTHEAAEVDEKTLFYSTDTGGTIVSTALTEMKRVIDARYSPSTWNIYAAQASDGDNTSSDNAHAVELFDRQILPLSQYSAYIEVGSEGGESRDRESDLWGAYKAPVRPDGLLAMRKIRSRREIFAVFHDLFARDRAAA